MSDPRPPRSRTAEPLWLSDEVGAAIQVVACEGTFAATGVSIDTRTLRPGDLFVALRGERDGHDFVHSAFARGAAGALVCEPAQGGPYVQTPDTQIALETLAAAARRRSPARRAAVTGSVGKTSVTQAIAAGLRLAGRSHAPEKSYNNHIGVPLTLARMPAATERAVFELGMNHAGEIARLSQLVRPEVAVVVAVGPVHIENFADGEAGVARAKAEIFEGLERGGTAVLNSDDAWFDLLADAARGRGARVLRFGRGEGCDAQLLEFDAAGQGSRVVARLHGRHLRFDLAQCGSHWGLNSLAALVCLEALGAPLDVGLEALAGFSPLQGRGARRDVETGAGPFTLIDESYNANPVSMRAAISTLGAHPGPGRRIAVLTDMLELGADAARRHGELAQPLETAEIDLVFCAGPMMRDLWDAIPAPRRGAWAESAERLSPIVLEAVRPGDVVMVKGSNGSRASTLAHALSSFPVSAGASAEGRG